MHRVPSSPLPFKFYYLFLPDKKEVGGLAPVHADNLGWESLGPDSIKFKLGSFLISLQVTFNSSYSNTALFIGGSVAPGHFHIMQIGIDS